MRLQALVRKYFACQHNALSQLGFDISGHSIDHCIKNCQVSVWSMDCPLLSIEFGAS